MNAYIGQINIFPYNFAPQGWLFCQGQLLPIVQNMALFSLIGTKFGGDGKTTFALPDYRDQAPAGSQYCIYVQGQVPQRAAEGE